MIAQTPDTLLKQLPQTTTWDPWIRDPLQFRDDAPFPRQHNSPKRKGANERVTGRKARDLQMEEIGCKYQTFLLSLLSGRRKKTTSVRFLVSLTAQLVKNPPAMQETPILFLYREDPLEKG